MDNIVIAFAGPIASGKSAVSSATAKTLNFPRASFGDYVRSVAVQRNLRQDREILQQIGSELIEGGWGPFCKAVLSQANWKKGSGIVIDGIRHIEAIDMLRQLTFPTKFVLVFISIEDKDRQARLETRGVKDKALQTKTENHATELQVSSLRDKADIILDGTQPISILVSQIIEFINRNI